MRTLIVALALAAEVLLVLRPLARDAAGAAGDSSDGPHVPLAAGPAACVLAAAGVAFLALVPLVTGGAGGAGRAGPVPDVDTRVVAGVHQTVAASPALETLARAASTLGDPAVRAGLCAAAVAVLLARRRFRTAVFVAVTVAGGAVADTALKAAVGRPRPALADPLAHAGGYSFPSGHAMGSTVTFGTLLLVAISAAGPAERTRACVFTAVTVVAVATSRVLLGVHYPSDVLGGCLAGTAWVALAVLVFGLVFGRVLPEPLGERGELVERR